MPGLPIVFFILAAIAVATALGTILSRNAVYSALFLVLNFATIAVLYLILGAPFIALSQITVYAGSIMVLFLFVIMLLGAEHLPESSSLSWQPWVAIPLALVLVGDFAVNIFQRMGANLTVAETPANYGDPAAVGQLLFTQYQLPFEITAVILLIAVVGAVVLAKPDRPSMQQIPGQAGRRLIPQDVLSKEAVIEKEIEEADHAYVHQPSEAEKTPLK
jgi:NADH-quinone oxidoreductase subunit J